HGTADRPCKEQRAKDCHVMNQYGDTYFKLWSNLYIPQYTQKMRPALEGYWYSSILYLKNMNDAHIVEREYTSLKQSYWMYAQRAVIPATEGLQFAYCDPREADEELAEAVSQERE